MKGDTSVLLGVKGLNICFAQDCCEGPAGGAGQEQRGAEGQEGEPHPPQVRPQQGHCQPLQGADEAQQGRGPHHGTNLIPGKDLIIIASVICYKGQR